MSTNSIKSPIKKVPPCWEDEKRMTALYSPFRSRETNPVDFDSKLKFWQNIIFHWCLEKNVCLFNIKTIQEEFRRNERVPLGLKTVLENLERNGEIKLKDDFLKISLNQTWTDWAVTSLVKAPVTWSFSKLMNALIEVDESTVDYVCLEFLKKKCEELVKKNEESGKILYNHIDLKNMLIDVEGQSISQESYDILLRWMQINKVIQVKNVESEIVIKFGNNKTSPISDNEISLYILEKNKLTFEKAIMALEQEKDDLLMSAKNCLKKGMRDSAKSYLRRKKEIEKTIAKRISAVENIESLLSRIHDTSTDSKVLDTYKIALNALKASFKEHGLSEEEVTNTVTEIQEINEMHEEIQNALAEPVSTICDIELDEELKTILASEAHKENIYLPDVPSDSPEAKSSTKKEIILPS